LEYEFLLLAEEEYSGLEKFGGRWCFLKIHPMTTVTG
jgi:hypothetical protein